MMKKMMTSKEKLYVISNYGEYASSIYKKSVGWSALPNTAMIFKTYDKAYRYMSKINNLYGYKRCRVERLNPREWAEWAWNQFSWLAM